MVRSKNDSLWKGVLEESFEDLLRFVYPDADRVFDLSRGVEFLDKELGEIYPEPDKPPGTRFVDKLAKVYKRGEGNRWVLCHVEVQGQYDKDFANRMYVYNYRIYERFKRPIMAIAVFSGKEGAAMPDVFVKQFKGTRIAYKYHKLCIQNFSDSTLEAHSNPFALIMLVAKRAIIPGRIRDEELLKEKLSIAKLIISRGYTKKKTYAMLAFLHNYIRFEKTETYRSFGIELDRLTGKKNTMGILEQIRQMHIDAAREEGVKEGRMEQSAKVAQALIEMSTFSDKEIAGISGVTETFVRKLRKNKK